MSVKDQGTNRWFDLGCLELKWSWHYRKQKEHTEIWVRASVPQWEEQLNLPRGIFPHSWKCTVHQKMPSTDQGMIKSLMRAQRANISRLWPRWQQQVFSIFHDATFDYPYYEIWVLLYNLSLKSNAKNMGCSFIKTFVDVCRASLAAMVMAAPINSQKSEKQISLLIICVPWETRESSSSWGA